MKRGFGSDNHSGVHPDVLAAIAEANVQHAMAYGVLRHILFSMVPVPMCYVWTQ